jgi:hypothetical protein
LDPFRERLLLLEAFVVLVLVDFSLAVGWLAVVLVLLADASGSATACVQLMEHTSSAALEAATLLFSHDP